MLLFNEIDCLSTNFKIKFVLNNNDLWFNESLFLDSWQICLKRVCEIFNHDVCNCSHKWSHISVWRLFSLDRLLFGSFLIFNDLLHLSFFLDIDFPEQLIVKYLLHLIVLFLSCWDLRIIVPHHHDMFQLSCFNFLRQNFDKFHQLILVVFRFFLFVKTLLYRFDTCSCIHFNRSTLREIA